MSNYKIVGLIDHNISLEFDGIVRNFPLPITDGLYPEGAELDALLTRYVEIQRLNASRQTVKANNEDAILAMVVAPTIVSNKINALNTPLAQRNVLLTLTDWTQLADTALSQEVVQKWQRYREELRGITSQPEYPNVITWPIPPFPVKRVNGDFATNEDGSPAAAKRPVRFVA